MTAVQEVLSVLENAGFERLPKPLTVAGAEFDFEAAARGTDTSHDLVLIATDHVSGRRLQRLVAGLARSLDRVESRRPMTLVLIGVPASTERIGLERFARVLPIPSLTPTRAAIEEAVAVLLPLKLPAAEIVHGSDPVNEVMAALGPIKATPEHIELVRASADGADGVRQVLRHYINTGAGWSDEVDDDE
ncbi:MAG: hypothetical protein CMH84_06575 [Nocardioides sp.]|nr:hypothetical protein [Nocardioides sp.]|tara:strand:+ start:2596 stop:3165 length:570 start_codon:yes stop_codon:yes gene_type:complete